MNRLLYSTNDPQAFVRQNSLHIPDIQGCIEYRNLLLDEVIYLTEEEFRQTNGDLAINCYIHGLAEHLLENECYFGVLSLLIVSGTIKVLLKVEVIARREMEMHRDRMLRSLRIIQTILCPKLLHTYKHCTKKPSRRIIVHWERMLSRMEMDDLPPLPEPLAMGKQIHDAHDAQYHARACGDLFCTHHDYHHVQLNDYGITSELLEAWFRGEEEDSD
jgi:hypothetical protein